MQLVLARMSCPQSEAKTAGEGRKMAEGEPDSAGMHSNF